MIVSVHSMDERNLSLFWTIANNIKDWNHYCDTSGLNLAISLLLALGL